MTRSVSRNLAVVLAAALLGGTHLACMSSTRSPATVSADKQKRRAAAAKKGKILDPKTTASQLVIHGEAIDAADLWRGLDTELDEQAKQRTPEGLESYVAGRASQLIRDRIMEVLLVRQATLRTPETFEQQVTSYIDGKIREIVTNEHDGRQRRYEKWLKSQGQSLDYVRSRLRTELLISSYLEQEIRPKVLEPTRDELFAEYQSALDQLRRPERRRMSLIEVRVSERLPKNIAQPSKDQVNAARDEAMAKIRTVRVELVGGADFADVARRDSEGLHASDGGVWDWLTVGSVRERFEPAVEALFALDQGELSRVIEGGDGFFVVRCDEIDKAETPDFETLQPQLTNRLFRSQYNRLVMERVEELRQKAKIPPEDLDRFFRAVIAAGLNRHNPPTP